MGIDPATGREIFLTKDGIPTFTHNANDEVKIGNSRPFIRGTIGSSLTWKKLTANINFGYELGGYIFNSALYNKVENISRQNIVYNQDRRALYDRWQQVGQVSQFRGISLTQQTPMSSRFIQKQNVLRATDFSVQWNFIGEEWIKSLGLSSLTAQLSTQDLFYISNVRNERSFSYPFARGVSLTISAAIY
jgi:hypothetical protein